MNDPARDPLSDIAHLLPPEMQAQRRADQQRLRQQNGSRPKAVGAGAVLVALFLKFKTVLLFLANFKWIALGAKFLLSFGTLVLSIWAWSQLFGLWFATGFVLLILVHEMGHVIAIRAYGLKASVPIFVPFLGAFIAMKEMPPNNKAAAIIALAGPALGTVGALACYAFGKSSGAPIWYALASTGFFINLFNLIPIYPLDGGRVAKALFSRDAPMARPLTLAIGAQAVGLAVFLFVMWHVAGAAAHYTS
jgi:Zn-dependent protease